jgi:hypothetical protein
MGRRLWSASISPPRFQTKEQRTSLYSIDIVMEFLQPELIHLLVFYMSLSHSPSTLSKSQSPCPSVTQASIYSHTPIYYSALWKRIQSSELSGVGRNFKSKPTGSPLEELVLYLFIQDFFFSMMSYHN